MEDYLRLIKTDPRHQDQCSKLMLAIQGWVHFTLTGACFKNLWLLASFRKCHNMMCTLPRAWTVVVKYAKYAVWAFRAPYSKRVKASCLIGSMQAYIQTRKQFSVFLHRVWLHRYNRSTLNRWWNKACFILDYMAEYIVHLKSIVRFHCW